mmetsp:Transcript_38450/g.107106  ORF Transcript_38450/g.107106 Transcript_38450/m.107106 type:complete len:254 (+) Transcript_38450:684-1445(+)
MHHHRATAVQATLVLAGEAVRRRELRRTRVAALHPHQACRQAVTHDVLRKALHQQGLVAELLHGELREAARGPESPHLLGRKLRAARPHGGEDGVKDPVLTFCQQIVTIEELYQGLLVRDRVQLARQLVEVRGHHGQALFAQAVVAKPVAHAQEEDGVLRRHLPDETYEMLKDARLLLLTPRMADHRRGHARDLAHGAAEASVCKHLRRRGRGELHKLRGRVPLKVLGYLPHNLRHQALQARAELQRMVQDDR